MEKNGEVLMHNCSNNMEDEIYERQSELQSCQVDVKIQLDKKIVTDKDTKYSKNDILILNEKIIDNEINDENEDKEIKKTRFPLAKIKNIMKMDDNVKLCQKNVYTLIGKATELFLQELAKNSYNITALNRRKTMNVEDISLKKVDRYNFINLKFLFDDILIDEINKKEEISQNKINASKEKSIAKKPKKNSETKVRKDNKTILTVNNSKIDSFFHKN